MRLALVSASDKSALPLAGVDETEQNGIHANARRDFSRLCTPARAAEVHTI